MSMRILIVTRERHDVILSYVDGNCTENFYKKIKKTLMSVKDQCYVIKLSVVFLIAR